MTTTTLDRTPASTLLPDVAAAESEPSLLALMTPAEKEHLKATYRRGGALEAGANHAQQTALAVLERGFDKHHPLYRPATAGAVAATYSRPGTRATHVLVRADGTIRVRQ